MPKVLLGLFVCVFAFFAFTKISDASAGLPTNNSTPADSVTNPYLSTGSFNYQTNQAQLGEYSQSVIIQILSAIACQLGGTNPVYPEKGCLGIDTEHGGLAYSQNSGGALGFVGNLIASTYYIPVSSGGYFTELASNFGIAQKAKAQITDESICDQFDYNADKYLRCLEYVQNKNNNVSNFSLGYGYTSLKPVMHLWEMFRNIMYLFIVLIFIIAGLGIMFRVNIDPRTVMSIQNVIPKFIVGLLLITFSYAIAGLLVDLMYVVMYVLYEVLSSQFTTGAGSAFNPAMLHGTSPIGAIGGLSGGHDIAKNVAGDFGPILASLLDNTFGRIIASIMGTIMGGGAGAAVGSVVPVVGTVVGASIGAAIGAGAGIFASGKVLTVVGGLFAYIIILIAVLWAMLRLWFILIKSYLYILVDVIFAPFWIGIGLLPGSSAGFGSWFRNIVANLAMFPTAIVFFMLGKILVDAFERPTPGAFMPPLIGNPTGPENFASLIGLGMLLMLPGIVSAFRNILKAPNFSYGKTIGENIGLGRSAAQIPITKSWGRAWRKPNLTTGEAAGPLRRLAAGQAAPTEPGGPTTVRQRAAFRLNQLRWNIFSGGGRPGH